MREVEELSHVIIATLKDLAQHQRPLTSSYLVQVLAEHHKTRELIARYKKDLPPEDDGCTLDKPDHRKTGAPTVHDEDLAQLKERYSEVLNAIQASLEGKQIEGFERLQRDVQACRNWNQLIGVNVEFISYVGDVLRTIRDERNQIAEFMGEVGNNLIEIEDRFQASIAHTRQTYQDNYSFGHMLEGEVEDIRESVRFSKNLSELRSFVTAKLTFLKEALEKKRSEDEHRMQETDQKMGSLLGDLNRMKQEIQEVHQHTQTLERKVVLDPLTGIHNRRAYERRIMEELHRFQRYQQRFSLILFDVDHFKSVNDRYGHNAGDRCLREIVKRVEPTLRKSDFMARYGGEEFIIILPGTTKQGGFETAERLRRLVEKTRFVYKGEHIPITISLGVTEAGSDDTGETLFERVDMAMYAAKEAGRNQSVSE
jgi:diguanylate cyclase